MNPVVFVGPSLSSWQRDKLVSREIAFAPPAKRGDIYRAFRSGANVIGLVDGLFRSVPAVLHKEILWVLDHGGVVMGAASMGALRGAELADFGMIGIGKIYDDFRRGRLWRDDEVAVEHAPAELGFMPTSEALVNIRRTLDFAVNQGKLTTERARQLVEVGSAMFYPERNYAALFERYELLNGDPAADADTLQWITSNKIDQKALDAIELLHALMNQAIRSGIAQPRFEFQDTIYFREYRERLANPFLRGSE